ncbi:MAG: response regulator transcription factor [Nitrospirota bacterium]
MALRLAIGCCHNLFAEGLRDLLADERDIKVVGIFTGIGGLLADLKDVLKLNPDVILTDFSVDFNNFISLPEDFFRNTRIKILLIGDRSIRFLGNHQLKDLIARGVVGILPPSADSDLLKKALKAVSTGELWLDRQTIIKLLACMRRQEGSVSLGKREKEIVHHICQGYRNKEIAQKLGISEQTVKSHCNRIYRKLGVSDRLQLALHYQKLWPDNADRGTQTEAADYR